MKKYSAQRKKLKRKMAISQKSYRKTLPFVFLFIISVGFLSVVGFYRSVSQKWASADSTSAYPLQNRNLASLLVAEVSMAESKPSDIRNIQVYLFNKTSKNTLIYEISAENVFDIPGKYGEEKLSKVFALGSLSEDGEKEGVNLLVKSVKKILGLNMDRYVLLESADYNNLKNLIENDSSPSILKTANSLSADSVATNMSLADIYELFNFSADSKQEVSKVTVDLSDSAYAEELDSATREATFDSVVSSEKKGVSVLNGATMAGVANYGSRIVENISGHVLSSSNAQRQYEESMLIVDDFSSDTAKYISEFFGVRNVVLKNQALDILENEIARSDITLILGFDIADTL